MQISHSLVSDALCILNRAVEKQHADLFVTFWRLNCLQQFS